MDEGYAVQYHVSHSSCVSAFGFFDALRAKSLSGVVRALTSDGAVSRLMLAETAVISLVGAIVGALLGSGVAQIVGHVVFGSGITMRPMVFVLVFVLLTLTVLIASFSSIRSILGLKPAEVLHGR